jgi:uncharacterized protein YebE (UPF0316 family)
VLLVCAIFLAEVSVVTLGTLRIIFISRGHKFLAPSLGFFEVSIWLFAITQTMRGLNDNRPQDWTLADWSSFLAFSLGFTLGNFLGILIEKKLALGSLKLHIITQQDAGELAQNLRNASFGATTMQGQGAHGPVEIIMTVIRRRQLAEILSIIESHDPRAFYAVNEVQFTSAGIFPMMQRQGPPAVDYTWHMVSQARPGEMLEESRQRIGA